MRIRKESDMKEIVKILSKHFLNKGPYIKLIRKEKHQRENWFLVEIIKALSDNSICHEDQPKCADTERQKVEAVLLMSLQ